MPGQPLFVQTSGHAYRLRMVGDSDVSVTHFLGLLGHLRDGILTIRGGGMHLQIPADIRQLYQPGEHPLLGRLNLSPVFPQFRWNQGKSHSFKEILFLRPAYSLIVLGSEYSIFTDFQAQFFSSIADGHIVSFRTSEIM